jgi:hypothetical protein
MLFLMIAVNVISCLFMLATGHLFLAAFNAIVAFLLFSCRGIGDVLEDDNVVDELESEEE